MSVNFFQQTGNLSAEELNWSISDLIDDAESTTLVISDNPKQLWQGLEKNTHGWESLVVVYQSSQSGRIATMLKGMQALGFKLDEEIGSAPDFTSDDDSQPRYICLLIGAKK